MPEIIFLRSHMTTLVPTRAAVCGAALSLALAAPAPAGAAVSCGWGGTPAARTGSFTISPGLRNEPAATPLKFEAVGQLAGELPGCRGRMRFVGQIAAGSVCASASFEGAVQGLPGVARFHGEGSVDVPSLLFDSAGNVVGIENAEIATESNLVNSLQCQTPGGFTGPAGFSSTLILF
jgi:hypothetical protein